MTRHVAVYRAYDYGGILLYVGTSQDPRARFYGHVLTANQWPMYVHRLSVQWYPSREAAERAEAVAIHDEVPVFNGYRPKLTVGVDMPPTSDQYDESTEWLRTLIVLREVRHRAARQHCPYVPPDRVRHLTWMPTLNTPPALMPERERSAA